MKRAIAIDGGGIKGLVPARLLERMLAACPELLAKVDLFAGTSTGGILALALAAGVTPDRCAQLYLDHGDRIFASRGLLDAATHADELFRANYSSDGLRAALEEVFGDMQLGDLSTDVLIPAFSLKTGRPKLFDRQHDAHARCVNVALATSAAPLFFPASEGYADGGLFANNPSDCAVSYLRKAGDPEDEIAILSLGTGQQPHLPPKELIGYTGDDPELDWGAKRWVVDKPHWLLSALFDGSVLAAVHRTRQQLGRRFHRVQPVLPRGVGLDDVTALPLLELVAAGHELDDTTAWLADHWGS